MAESTSLTRSNAKEDVLARLAKYEHTPPHLKEEVAELPRWVKTALVLRAVNGESYNEAAARTGKSAGTLAKYARSPAAKKWLESLEEFIEDPIAMAKAYLSANAMSVTLERFIFLQAAIDAGDYKEGDKIARDLQDRMGIIQKRQDSGAIKIELSLGAGGLDTPTIEASYEVISDGSDGDE